jgi:uncharacterized membrane protein YdbT with pleckstrin-like domain
MEAEKTVHQACPSQLLNLFPFFLSVLLFAGIIVASVEMVNNYILLLLIIPVAYAGWRWLTVSAMRFKLTDQRIIISKGVLNKTTNETELYRVRDTSIEEPFFYRIFGLGNIVVYTTDEAIPTHKFIAYKKPHWVKDQIRNHAELCRQQKRWGNDNVLLHDHSV